MSELEPSSEPSTYDAITYESLDPPKVDEGESFGSDVTGLEQAAEERKRTSAERGTVVERAFVDPEDWNKIAPGNRSVSAEHAADVLKATRDAEERLASEALDSELVQAIDENRNQAATGKIADELTAPVEQPAVELQPEAAPELPKGKLAAAFQDPEFRQEFETQYGQTLAQLEGARQQFAAGIQQANVNAVASLVAGFPELLQIQNEQQLQGALATMNPERKAALEQHFGRVQHIINAAQQQAAQQQQQQQARAQQELAAYKEQQDNLAGKNWAHESPDTVRAIQAEVVRGAEEYGIPKQQLQQLYENNPVVRHHAFQNMMADAARYRLAQRAVARGAARPVPHVQRPGAAEVAVARDSSEVSDLQARFNLAVNRGAISESRRLGAQLIAAKQVRAG